MGWMDGLVTNVLRKDNAEGRIALFSSVRFRCNSDAARHSRGELLIFLNLPARANGVEFVQEYCMWARGDREYLDMSPVIFIQGVF